MKPCGEGLHEPLKILYLKRHQHEVSGVIQVHGTLWIHDVMSCSGPDVHFIAFGTTMVHSKQYRGIYSCVSSWPEYFFKGSLEFEFF